MCEISEEVISRYSVFVKLATREFTLLYTGFPR